MRPRKTFHHPCSLPKTKGREPVSFLCSSLFPGESAKAVTPAAPPSVQAPGTWRSDRDIRNLRKSQQPRTQPRYPALAIFNEEARTGLQVGREGAPPTEDEFSAADLVG